jgi:hypothetical protein
MKTREELENAINGSPLFSIDRDRDSELFHAEELKFLKYLVEYVERTRKPWDIELIGYSGIWHVAKNCTKPNAYTSEKGSFSHYFNRALTHAINHEKVKECQLQKQNIFGNISISGEDWTEGSELLDMIADTKTDPPDEKIINENMIKYLVNLINPVFRIQQERTKKLLSKLLTIRLAEILLSVYSEIEIIQKTVFVDTEILSGYIGGGELPTAKQIAAKENTTEQQASRTINRFLEKLMENDKFSEICTYMKVGGAV